MSDLHRHPRYDARTDEDGASVCIRHERLATIVHRYSGSYYHWLIEATPRLLQVRAELAADPDMRVLVDYDDRATAPNHWTDDCLRLLGVDLRQVVRYDPSKIYVAAEVLVPGPVLSGMPIRDRITPVRQALRKKIEPSHPGCIIAVDRSAATCRRITNWETAMAAIRGACPGREVIDVDLMQLDVTRQIALFAGASLVVAAHGAGLANVIFCPPSARVLEIIPEDYRRPGLCFARLCREMGLSHRYHVVDASGANDDFAAPPGALALAVTAFLSACLPHARRSALLRGCDGDDEGVAAE
jgi:capsular polysaccharide biosynthesis protein